MTRRQSFKAILFSAFAFALTLVVATDAFAQLLGRTRTGGSTYPGSTISTTIKFFDDTAHITSPSETGVGNFFDITAATPDGQTVACVFNDGTNSVNAQCKTSVTCRRFSVGQACSGGQRTSRMMCPTTPPAGSTLGAGCEGQVTVIFSDGRADHVASFHVDPTISSTGQCKNQFPNVPPLGEGVIGQIVQSCTGPAWDASDPVLSEIVRNDVERGQTTFRSDTSWADALGATCNASNGFPTGACTNDGGTWLTVLNNPIVDAKVCAASADQLSCGQQLVEGVLELGPAPKECRVNSQGQCECRCARCNSNGTLVNLGDPNIFVLADANGATGRRWAAACQVTVTGN